MYVLIAILFPIYQTLSYVAVNNAYIYHDIRFNYRLFMATINTSSCHSMIQ